MGGAKSPTLGSPKAGGIRGVLAVELLPSLYCQGEEGKEILDLFPSLRDRTLCWGMGVFSCHFKQ